MPNIEEPLFQGTQRALTAGKVLHDCWGFFGKETPMIDPLYLLSAVIAAVVLGFALLGYAKRHSLDTARMANWGLVLIGLLFLAWRLPSMYREPGWQDEECYAVPGLTILETGRPQLPHLPSRNVKSPYYRVDELVFLEPPLYFYVQAGFYAVLPAEYGTARLPSAAAGMLLLFLAGHLAVRCGASAGAALWGMGLFMMSRWFYFSAFASRPDMLCSAFGLLAILATLSWTETKKWRWLFASGMAIGLGGLTHPFALAYAVQMAGWMALAGRGRERVIAPLMLAAVAMLVAALWLLLIVQEPEIFQIQFRNQFLRPIRGGPLWERLVWPFDSFMFHAKFLWPHMGWWQFFLPFAGTAACFVFGRIEARPALWAVGWLAISGAGLICVLVGPHHPVFGYFSYPSALAFVGVGWGIDRAMSAMCSWRRFGRMVSVALGMGLVVSLLMGSRIRMNLAYLQNARHIHFNAPRFAESLLKELPTDAVYVVDEEFALDFLADGRKVIAHRAFFDKALPQSTAYDYRIASRSTDRYYSHVRWEDELVWVFGDPGDPYGCFAYVYRRIR